MNESEKSVLLVDDNEKLVSALARMFKDKSFDVHTAVSAAEALVILNRSKIDVIVSDNQMSGTNGTRLLALVKKQFPHVLRFMLTGDISKSQSMVVENEIGVCEIFEKPCSAAKIMNSVINALSVAAEN